MQTMNAFFFRLARTAFGGALLGWLLAHLSFALPLRRLRETRTLLAFHHPQPSYPVHIVLAPKKAIASLMALEVHDAEFLSDLFATVQSLVAEFHLDEDGYRLIVNGGANQEVAQLHFHLISGVGSLKL
jgi:histidine triad (HIT) family protein